jgi:hypothetical protein
MSQQVTQDVIDKANAYKRQKKGWAWIAGKLGVAEVELRKAVAGEATHEQAKPLTPHEAAIEAGEQSMQAQESLQKSLNKLRDEGIAGGVTDATMAEVDDNLQAYTQGKQEQRDHAKAAAGETPVVKEGTPDEQHKNELLKEAYKPRKQRPKFVQGEGKRVLTQPQAILRAIARADKPRNALHVAQATGIEAKAVELNIKSLVRDELLEEGPVAGYFKLTPLGKEADEQAPVDGVNPPRKPKFDKAELHRIEMQKQRAAEEGAQAAADVAGVSNAEMQQRIAKPGKPTRVKKEPKPKAEKANWEGYGMCELLRWCGKHGMNKNLGAAVVKALGVGFDPRPNTMAIQNSWGRNGTEPAPDLSEKQAAHLRKLAKDLEKTVEAPRGKAKADKPAKKGTLVKK